MMRNAFGIGYGASIQLFHRDAILETERPSFCQAIYPLRSQRCPIATARAIIVATLKNRESFMTDNPILEPPALRSFDSLPVRTATPDMLDMEKVDAHIARLVKERQYRGPTDPIEYLHQRR